MTPSITARMPAGNSGVPTAERECGPIPLAWLLETGTAARS
jgi:hypothetical protein